MKNLVWPALAAEANFRIICLAGIGCRGQLPHYLALAGEANFRIICLLGTFWVRSAHVWKRLEL